MTATVRHPLYILAVSLVLLGFGLPSHTAFAQQRVGVDSGVNPSATGIPPGALPRRLVLGQDVVFNERITTEQQGQTQVLFVDESTLSVGPNANMVIDQFVYDPTAGTGKLVASLGRGVFRFVGGKLSKQDNAVTLRTPTATIGIRGGVVLIDQAANGHLEVEFVYGKGVTITGLNGASQTIYRPGFAVSVAGPGAAPSDPGPAPPGFGAGALAQLDGHIGSSGGAPAVPTEATVTNSGIANVISGNLPASIQAAAKTQPTPAQPPSANQTVQYAIPPTTYQVTSVPPVSPSTVTVIPSPTVAPPVIPSPVIPVVMPPTPVTPTTPTTPVTPVTPVTPQPPVVSVAGLAKVADPATDAGFVKQTAGYRIPYTNGTITYPAGTGLQNGTFAASIASTGRVTLSPLTPGTTNVVAATAANGATATGTATMTADGNFFYANLVPTTPGGSNERLFIFGGVPVNSSFYAPTTTNQITAFTANPDAALASATSPQTIPFLPSNYGGTLPVLPGNVSPLYVVTTAGQPFGNFNANTNPNGAASHYLQASLAVNGQGADQSSALVVATGSFSTSNAGNVYAAGPVRGTVFQSATGPLVAIASANSTVPDGNGNNLFGGNTLSGFVLDQNSYSNGNPVLQLASAGTYQSGVGVSTTNYAFNQPVTTTPLPASASGARQALTESGYFGGIMQCCSTNSQTNAIISYAVAGGTVVQTFPSDNRVVATFAGVDPFTQAQSGVNEVELQFGVPNTPGVIGYGRSTYINNQIYAAAENPNTASSITINGVTASLPTYVSGSDLYPRLAMVTSGTVPNNSWMPAGVTPCSCQYLQWGYWTGHVYDNLNSTGTANGRNDIAEINTWVAGQPTVNLPTTGVGTYNGAAVGTVSNAGATYLAAGGFNQTYNFGSRTGTVNITRFDGANYTAAVSGESGAFAGALQGSFGNRNGTVIGNFYGPAAAETGGTFNIYNGQPVASAKYLASGIFAGKQIP